MPDSSGPWDGSPWGEADWYRYMRVVAASGVVGNGAATATDGALAWSSVGLSITPAAGQAFVGGAGYSHDVPLTSISAALNPHSTLSRRDLLVLRRSTAAHSVALAVIQGTPAASPVAPSYSRTDTVWDLPLHSFVVPANNGTTLSGVQDKRVWLPDTDPGDALRAVQASVSSLSTTVNTVKAQVLVPSTGRVGFTQNGKVNPNIALFATVSIPAVPYATRLVCVASGRAGFDTVDRQCAWGWDSISASATNVEVDTAEQTFAHAAKWTAVTNTLSMDVPANVTATFRLVNKADGDCYNRGAVTWTRTLLP